MRLRKELLIALAALIIGLAAMPLFLYLQISHITASTGVSYSLPKMYGEFYLILVGQGQLEAGANHLLTALVAWGVSFLPPWVLLLAFRFLLHSIRKLKQPKE